MARQHLVRGLSLPAANKGLRSAGLSVASGQRSSPQRLVGVDRRGACAIEAFGPCHPSWQPPLDKLTVDLRSLTSCETVDLRLVRAAHLSSLSESSQ